MTVADVLRFYAELKGMRDCRPAIAGWLERMGLSAWADKPVEALSKGLSQKVQFIATVVARPHWSCSTSRSAASTRSTPRSSATPSWG
jgi:ABC-2 type transport system ATP-binding protein